MDNVNNVSKITQDAAPYNLPENFSLPVLVVG
jgi:hypothetical protein